MAEAGVGEGRECLQDDSRCFRAEAGAWEEEDGREMGDGEARTRFQARAREHPRRPMRLTGGGDAGVLLSMCAWWRDLRCAAAMQRACEREPD